MRAALSCGTARAGYSPHPADLTGLAFTDFKNGWVVGDRGTILRTTDGGFNWAPYGRSPHTTFYGTVFLNGKRGVAVGDKGTIVQIVVP